MQQAVFVCCPSPMTRRWRHPCREAVGECVREGEVLLQTEPDTRVSLRSRKVDRSGERGQFCETADAARLSGSGGTSPSRKHGHLRFTMVQRGVATCVVRRGRRPGFAYPSKVTKPCKGVSRPYRMNRPDRSDGIGLMHTQAFGLGCMNRAFSPKSNPVSFVAELG